MQARSLGKLLLGQTVLRRSSWILSPICIPRSLFVGLGQSPLYLQMVLSQLTWNCPLGNASVAAVPWTCEKGACARTAISGLLLPQGILTSLNQKEAIAKAYQDQCPGVPWGAFFEDPEASVLLPLAKRKAGRQLVRQLQPGDHVLATRLDRLFQSLEEAKAYLTTWNHQGIHVHLLDCAGVPTSTPEGSALLLHTLAACADFQRSRIREPLALRMQDPPSEPGWPAAPPAAKSSTMRATASVTRERPPRRCACRIPTNRPRLP